MKRINYVYSVVALLFLTFSVGICETIWLPSHSESDNWMIPIANNVVIIDEGKTHVLENAVIEGANKKLTYYKCGLDLSAFIQFDVHEYIQKSDYDIKNDARGYYCGDCMGRSRIYVPIYLIHKIAFPKKWIAEIHFHNKTKPIYAYSESIRIRGKEDLGAFGKSDINTNLGVNEGDEIIFPDKLPVSEINKKSGLSCIVTMKGGRKVNLSDCRLNEMVFEHNGTYFPLLPSKVSRIYSTGGEPEYLVELKTGEKQEFGLNYYKTCSIYGKGKLWFEGIYWKDVNTIVFQ